MLRKKLASIACAIAIVGMGACFLPPERVPPPPLPPYLGHIRTFSIEVHDASGDSLVDDGAMSQKVASEFNRLWKDYGIRATAARESRTRDAVLLININRKSISNSESFSGKRQWTFHLTLSMTLSAGDGRLLWEKHEKVSQFRLWLDDGSVPDGWNSHKIEHEVVYWLAMNSGDLFYDVQLDAR